MHYSLTLLNSHVSVMIPALANNGLVSPHAILGYDWSEGKTITLITLSHKVSCDVIQHVQRCFSLLCHFGHPNTSAESGSRVEAANRYGRGQKWRGRSTSLRDNNQFLPVTPTLPCRKSRVTRQLPKRHIHIETSQHPSCELFVHPFTIHNR